MNTINRRSPWPVLTVFWLAIGLAVVWLAGALAAVAVIVTQVHPLTPTIDSYGNADGEDQLARMLWAVFIGVAGLANLVPAGLWFGSAVHMAHGQATARRTVLGAGLYSCMHTAGLGLVISWWPYFPVIMACLGTATALGLIAVGVTRLPWATRWPDPANSSG